MGKAIPGCRAGMKIAILPDDTRDRLDDERDSLDAIRHRVEKFDGFGS